MAKPKTDKKGHLLTEIREHRRKGEVTGLWGWCKAEGTIRPVA